MDKEREEELNLHFDSGDGTEDLRLARQELEEDLAAEDVPEAVCAEAQEQPPDEEPAGDDSPRPAAPPAETSAEIPADAPATGPAAMPESGPAVPRSRMPANRPAGTMPLTAAAGPAAPEIRLEGKSYGAVLREMRERRGLDYAALENATKILPRYLEALEKEDLKNLPSVVYVIAYIRTLCRYYGIGDDRSEALVRELKRELIPTCSDELLNTLEIDSSASEAHEKLLRRVLWGAIGGAGLLIVLIGVGIYLARRPALPETAGKTEARAEQFDEKRLDSLLEPPILELTRLPVAK